MYEAYVDVQMFYVTCIFDTSIYARYMCGQRRSGRADPFVLMKEFYVQY